MRGWRNTRLAPLAGIVLFTAAGCSTTTSTFKSCSDNSQCRDAFGLVHAETSAFMLRASRSFTSGTGLGVENPLNASLAAS